MRVRMSSRMACDEAALESAADWPWQVGHLTWLATRPTWASRLVSWCCDVVPIISATANTISSPPHGNHRLAAVVLTVDSAGPGLLGPAERGFEVGGAHAAHDVEQHDAVGVDEERLGHPPHAPVHLGRRRVDHRPVTTVGRQVRPHGLGAVVV